MRKYGVEKQGFIANDVLVFPVELKFQLILTIEQRKNLRKSLASIINRR